MTRSANLGALAMAAQSKGQGAASSKGHGSQQTTDHETIRKWVEHRGGRPASVAKTHSEDDAGILRIDFAEPTPSLEEISWDEFFQKFDEQELALLYQDETKDGGTSRFFKFVRR
jgi:hypothetical protein